MPPNESTDLEFLIEVHFAQVERIVSDCFDRVLDGDQLQSLAMGKCPLSDGMTDSRIRTDTFFQKS